MVITCSDGVSRGERTDSSGVAVREILERNGYAVVGARVVPDQIEPISAAIVEAVDALGARLVVTTGGTGIAPSDVTPEATALVTSKPIAGFGELMRLRSLEKTAMAPLSRSGAAVRGNALVLNLPGSPRGAAENLEIVLSLLPHAIELLGGTPVLAHPQPDETS
jgi:molybdopterin adenylyltransferase